MRHRRWIASISLSIAGAVCAIWLAQRALAAYVWGRLTLPDYPSAQLPAPLTSASAQTCRACHPQQYDDWSASRMGQAMTDPFFLADWADQDHVFVCLSCHAPLPEQQPMVVHGLASLKPLRPLGTDNPRFDPALQREGVTCVVCHLIDGVMVGPDGDRAPHPTRGDPAFREASRCEPCHQVDIPPLAPRLDRPLADTVAEWRRWRAQTGRTETCTDCHMPGRRHTFPGAFDADLLRSGLEVQLDCGAPETIGVTLTNRAGHRFPSADPLRALVIRHGDAEIVLARRVPLPRYVDLSDTTLEVSERRTVSLPRTRGADLIVTMQPVRFLPSAPHQPEIEFLRLSCP